MTDLATVILALSAAAGAWVAAPTPLAIGVLVIVAALGLRRPMLVCAGVGLLASGLADRAWDGVAPPHVGHWSGTATLVGDPAEIQGALRVVMRIDGKRVEAWARGGAAGVLRDRLAGERVTVSGQIRPVPASARERLARRHIGARMSVRAVEAWGNGDPASRLANGLRRTLLDGVQSMPRERRALYSGFVLGDDREQAVEVADDFKASGLSHLLVVSGQNVAFTLAVFSPLLQRLSLRSRLAAGLVVLFLFGVLTRWEPSVLRAEAMAALALVAGAWGRPISRVRLLSLAVTGVLLIDPLLIGSIGFLLSVGACTGIALLAAPLTRLLPGPRPLAAAAGVTLAAQAGVAPVLVPVFGGIPVASLPANLLALPAAAPIMIWGITAGLPAGLVGSPLAEILHFPTDLLIAWVAAVARWAASLPLGQLSAAHSVALAAALAGWGMARAAGSAKGGRWCALAVVGIVAVASLPVVRPRTVEGQHLIEGARLWRRGAAAVLVVDGVRSPERLMAAMHPAAVRHLDVLVVVRPGVMAARGVEPLIERYPPRLLLAPEQRLSGAQVPEEGEEYGVGALTVRIERASPRLEVSVH